MESGHRSPSFDDIKNICSEMNIDPSVFFNDDGFSFESVSNSPGIYGHHNSNNRIEVNEELLKSLVSTLDRLTSYLDGKIQRKL